MNHDGPRLTTNNNNNNNPNSNNSNNNSNSNHNIPGTSRDHHNASLRPSTTSVPYHNNNNSNNPQQFPSQQQQQQQQQQQLVQQQHAQSQAQVQAPATAGVATRGYIPPYPHHPQQQYQQHPQRHHGIHTNGSSNSISQSGPQQQQQQQGITASVQLEQHQDGGGGGNANNTHANHNHNDNRIHDERQQQQQQQELQQQELQRKIRELQAALEAAEDAQFESSACQQALKAETDMRVQDVERACRLQTQQLQDDLRRLQHEANLANSRATLLERKLREIQQQQQQQQQSSTITTRGTTGLEWPRLPLPPPATTTAASSALQRHGPSADSSSSSSLMHAGLPSSSSSRFDVGATTVPQDRPSFPLAIPSPLGIPSSTHAAMHSIAEQAQQPQPILTMGGTKTTTRAAAAAAAAPHHHNEDETLVSRMSTNDTVVASSSLLLHEDNAAENDNDATRPRSMTPVLAALPAFQPNSVASRVGSSSFSSSSTSSLNLAIHLLSTVAPYLVVGADDHDDKGVRNDCVPPSCNNNNNNNTPASDIAVVNSNIILFLSAQLNHSSPPVHETNLVWFLMEECVIPAFRKLPAATTTTMLLLHSKDTAAMTTTTTTTTTTHVQALETVLVWWYEALQACTCATRLWILHAMVAPTQQQQNHNHSSTAALHEDPMDLDTAHAYPDGQSRINQHANANSNNKENNHENPLSRATTMTTTFTDSSFRFRQPRFMSSSTTIRPSNRIRVRIINTPLNNKTKPAGEDTSAASEPNLQAKQQQEQTIQDQCEILRSRLQGNPLTTPRVSHHVPSPVGQPTEPQPPANARQSQLCHDHVLRPLCHWALAFEPVSSFNSNSTSNQSSTHTNNISLWSVRIITSLVRHVPTRSRVNPGVGQHSSQPANSASSVASAFSSLQLLQPWWDHLMEYQNDGDDNRQESLDLPNEKPPATDARKSTSLWNLWCQTATSLLQECAAKEIASSNTESSTQTQTLQQQRQPQQSSTATVAETCIPRRLAAILEGYSYDIDVDAAMAPFVPAGTMHSGNTTTTTTTSTPQVPIGNHVASAKDAAASIKPAETVPSTIGVVEQWMAAALHLIRVFWRKCRGRVVDSTTTTAATRSSHGNDWWFQGGSWKNGPARRLLASVLDVMEFYILPQKALYSSPLSLECVAWLHCLLDDPDEGFQLVRTRFATLHSTATQWHRGPSAIGLCICFFHNLVLEQMDSDHLPAVSLLRNAQWNVPRDALIRFLYGILCIVQHKRHEMLRQEESSAAATMSAAAAAAATTTTTTWHRKIASKPQKTPSVLVPLSFATLVSEVPEWMLTSAAYAILSAASGASSPSSSSLRQEEVEALEYSTITVDPAVQKLLRHMLDELILDEAERVEEQILKYQHQQKQKMKQQQKQQQQTGNRKKETS